MSKRFLQFCFVLAVLLAVITGAVYAASGIINAGDGLIDPHWLATPLISDESVYTGDSFADIKKGWVLTDSSTPTEVAFRIETAGNIDTVGVTSYILQVDCDDNGAFFDTADWFMIYRPSTNRLILFFGDMSDSIVPADSSEAQGEVVGEAAGPLNTVEVVFKKAITGRTGKTGWPEHWTTCFNHGARSVRFLTFDNQYFVILDRTNSARYNVPTAVTLSWFEGHAATAIPAWGGPVGLSLVVLAGFWLRRGKRRLL